MDGFNSRWTPLGRPPRFAGAAAGAAAAPAAFLPPMLLRPLGAPDFAALGGMTMVDDGVLLETSDKACAEKEVCAGIKDHVASGGDEGNCFN